MRKLFLVMAAFGAAAAAPAAQAAIVARTIHVIIDQAGPTHGSDMGKDHEARVFYDDSMIDPVTHRVKILHEQHTPMMIPKHPDPVVMPVANAWLDLGSKPYRYHLAASPGVECIAGGRTLWKPYSIVFDENTHRMTIRTQATGDLELSGKYEVEERVQSGPEIEAVIKDAPSPSSYPPRCP